MQAILAQDHRVLRQRPELLVELPVEDRTDQEIHGALRSIARRNWQFTEPALIPARWDPPYPVRQTR